MTEAGPAAATRAASRSDNSDRSVRLEQMRMVYHHVPTSFSGTLVGACLVVAMMWPVIAHWLLLAWLAGMVANQAWRLGIYLRFRRSGIDPRNLPQAALYWAVGAGISGLLWGAAGILFFVADSPVHQLLLIASVFAITSVGVPLLASHPASFYAFVVPILLSLIGRNAWEADTPHLLLAFIVTAMGIGVLAVGRGYYALLSESLHIRFDNEALADRLSAQNTDLECARNVAEQASRAKTQFFAAASHDLRQPLHAMGLFAAALAERVREPDVRNVVNSINASVDALESLFNELLDISKIDAGAIRPNVSDVPLRPLLERIRADLEPEALEKGLGLRLHSPRAFAYSDPLLLERILRNLINNAVRYTEHGGILVGVRRRGDRLRIEVWDTGIGIARNQQEKIFEEFYQLHNPERDRKKGLGLGLSIVQRLCELLGHPLALHSRPGRGTVFRLDVPVGRATQPATAPAAQDLVFTDFSGSLILVVDDEAPVREGMAALLGGWGARVVGCAGVADTLDALHGLARAPDLIVSDYQLREGEVGTDAILAVRKHFGIEIPAIMVTGSTTPERVADAQSHGCRLLLKPVMPAKLRTLINFTLREGC